MYNYHPHGIIFISSVILQCRHLIPTLNTWAAQAYRPDYHPVSWGRMQLQVSDLTTESRFDSQATWSLICLAYSLTCYPWVFVQPGTDRRPGDRSRNKMSVLYVKAHTLANLKSLQVEGNRRMHVINRVTELENPLEIVVWVCDNFGNN